MSNESRITGRMRRALRLKPRTQRPKVEALEPRLLLTTPGGFLQGIVTVSTASGLIPQPAPGAMVELQSLDVPPTITPQSTTTDANGVYTFQGLPIGTYRITEMPPSDYTNFSSTPNSPLTPILNHTASTIDVQLGDPSQLLVHYPSNNKEDLFVTSNGLTKEGLIGQSNITVSEPDIGFTSPLFPTFCIDFYRNILTGDSNLPYSMEPLSTGLSSDPNVKNPQNAGEIAYLYNMASTWSTDPGQYVPAAEAAGLQLAIWELEYETTSTLNVLNGSFYVGSGLDPSSPEVTYAQSFLAMAQGQNELAVYLNGLPTTNRPLGSQGLIAPESLDFTNVHNGPTVPCASISGVVFDDCSDDGIQQADEMGIAGVTITLNGVDDLGNTVTMVTMTNSQGAYNFTPLNPGTYSLTETQPAGYFQGINSVGTVNGVHVGQLGPGVDVISNIMLVSCDQGINYNFAEISPSSLSGVVYYDLNHNGVMDSPDFGIAHVTVTLDGTNDLGQSVQMTTVTNDEGQFSFDGLRPGTYDIIQTPPSIFRDYKNTVGSLGGTVNTNSFTDINVPGCAEGVGYLFGHLQRPYCKLRDLAIHVGNVFYHFEQTYQRNPVGFAKVYPNLTPSIAAGKVPWGKSPFPSATGGFLLGTHAGDQANQDLPSAWGEMDTAGLIGSREISHRRGLTPQVILGLTPRANVPLSNPRPALFPARVRSRLYPDRERRALWTLNSNLAVARRPAAQDQYDG